MTNVLNKISSKKTYITSAVAIMLLSIATSAFAAEAPDFAATTASIESSFGGLAKAALSVLGSLAVVAISLFAGIYIWRYAKSVFNVISKN